jgi:putative SOS response-associated peptidase YedK
MDTCTIIVLGANKFIGEVHDRMPAVIQPQDRLVWLDAPRPDLLKAAPEDHLQMWKVTPRLNASRYHEADPWPGWTKPSARPFLDLMGQASRLSE